MPHGKQLFTEIPNNLKDYYTSPMLSMQNKYVSNLVSKRNINGKKVETI